MRRGGKRVGTVSEYWLNEEQALLVSVLSDAPNAPAVRAMLIKVFVAWRRGNTEPSAAFVLVILGSKFPSTGTWRSRRGVRLMRCLTADLRRDRPVAGPHRC